jgi:hypothetical protein
MLDQTGHGALGQGIGDGHLHLVAVCQKPHVQRAEIAAVTYS